MKEKIRILFDWIAYHPFTTFTNVYFLILGVVFVGWCAFVWQQTNP